MLEQLGVVRHLVELRSKKILDLVSDPLEESALLLVSFYYACEQSDTGTI